MADITITPANVVAGSNAVIQRGTAGAIITQGQVVYKDSADGKYKLADCDSATAAAKVPVGIALNGASDGQPMAIVTGGDVTIGGTLVAGTTYCLSATPGGIAPQADITSGDNVVILGAAKSTTVLAVAIAVLGVTL